MKKFEEKYSEYVIDERIIDLLILPPKYSYHFEANEGEKKAVLVSKIDMCENEEYYVSLTCWDDKEIVYTINGEAAVLEHLDNYDCFDS